MIRIAVNIWHVAASTALVAAYMSIASISSAASRDSFETLELSWHLVERDCPVNVLQHTRSTQQPHSGEACEFLRVQCGQGTKVLFAHEIAHARIISELAPSLWVKSDRPGIQLLARIVLPNTRAPEHDKPATVLVAGSLYRKVGSWQRLAIDNPEQQLAEQVRFLRNRLADVDSRGAYMDMIALNVYGGEGNTSIWIDDLEIAFQVIKPLSDTPPAAPVHDNQLWQPKPKIDTPTVRLVGSVLEANGKPLLVRAIEHNGESFDWLAARGFNAVRLRRPPTATELHQAEQASMWLIAPPPQSVGRPTIDPSLDRVLAWDLGDDLTNRDFESTRRLAGEVRNADPRRGRPLLCIPAHSIWDFRQIADVAVFDLEPIGSCFELAEQADRLRQRSQLARGGTPFWAAIETQPPPALLEQVAAVDPQSASIAFTEPQQIRQQVYHAIAAGARGVLFRSKARLDGSDDATKLRAATISLINLELEFLQPWAAAGTLVGRLSTSDPRAWIAVLKTDRSRLLLLMKTEDAEQHVACPSTNLNLSFIDDGATSSAMAYQFTLGAGLVNANHVRRPDGLRVWMNSAAANSLLVVTDDPLVRKYLATYPQGLHQRAAELNYDIAAGLLELTTHLKKPPESRAGLTSRQAMLREWQIARDSLRRCRELLDSGDYQASQVYGTAAANTTARIRQALWREAAAGFSSPTTSPFCCLASTLPVHWQLSPLLQQAHWSPNVIAGGDFENLDQMRSAGWRQHRQAVADVLTDVELAPDWSRRGSSALRIRAWSPDPQAMPTVLEAAPVSISSAPVPVRAGQVVRLHGWVKIPAEITATDRGLTISDSIVGEHLAQCVRQVSDWREFTLYRVAPHDAQIHFTFALTGLGEIWLDNISVVVADIGLNQTYTETRNAQSSAAIGSLPVDIPR